MADAATQVGIAGSALAPPPAGMPGARRLQVLFSFWTLAALLWHSAELLRFYDRWSQSGLTINARRGLGSGLDQPAGWHSLSLAEPSRTFGSQAHTCSVGDERCGARNTKSNLFWARAGGKKSAGEIGDPSQCEYLKLLSRSRPYYRPAVTDPSALRRRAYTTTPRPCAMLTACRYSRTVRGCNRAPAPSTTSQRPRIMASQ